MHVTSSQLNNIANWGNPILGKSSSNIPAEVVRAQIAVLNVLVRNHKNIGIIKERIDMVADPVTLEKLVTPIAIGVTTRSQPIVFIKAKKNDDDLILQFKLETRSADDQFLAYPRWRVVNGEGFFIEILYTDRLAAKLTNFFDHGLVLNLDPPPSPSVEASFKFPTTLALTTASIALVILSTLGFILMSSVALPFVGLGCALLCLIGAIGYAYLKKQEAPPQTTPHQLPPVSLRFSNDFA